MTNRNISEKIKKETILLVELFLKTNASDNELSKMTNISSSTVGRRLTNELIIKECFPDNKELFEIIKDKRQNNLKKGRILGEQKSLLNKEVTNHLKLDILDNDEEKQYKFLTQIILTYRVKLDLLSKLFQIEEQILLDNLLKYNNNLKNSLFYLFYVDSYDEEFAKYNIILFYKRLVEALLKKDKELYLDLIKEINDNDIKLFVKNKKDLLNKEDIRLLINYQLKYALSSKEMSNIFQIDELIYNNLVNNYLSGNEILNKRYNELLSYINNGVNYGRKDI